MSYDSEGLTRVDVHPGERFSTSKSLVISTLLGSCVSACLYDDTAGVSGLNHFLLAAPRYAKSMPLSHTDAGRYGIHAMELLINDMIKLGAVRKRLKAKVFGAGSVLELKPEDRFFCVSEVNARFIREYLKTEGIALMCEDLGGDLGRVIRFHTDTKKVWRRFIKKAVAVEIEEEERRYWKRALEVPADRESKIVLF